MKKNALEWTVFGVGLLLVVALAAVLVVEAFQGPGTKADLRVRLEAPEKIPGGYRTHVTVENRGDEPTMAVRVKVDDADLDLDYVPRRSTRKGYVVTEKPPKEGKAVSWQVP